MKKPPSTVLLLSLLAAFALSACGDSGGQGERSSSTPRSEEVGPANSGSRDESRYEGSEETVERYGSEARGSRAEAIVGAERGYLLALAKRDFGTACSYLVQSVTRSLVQTAPPQLRAKDCPLILPRFLRAAAFAAAREQAKAKIRRVRVEGNQAFVIFHAPGARLFVFGLQRERGAWKATTIAASILAPLTPGFQER